MSNQTVRVVARVIALPEKVEELKAALRELIEPTRQEAGCIQYELLQNQSDPTDFNFVEEWNSNDAINAHLDSAHIEVIDSKLDGLVAAELDIRRYNLLA